jgi:crotonobetainyl-CoA:carnitine CoA-transferase CaiB-like acyl-CoA transferase
VDVSLFEPLFRLTEFQAIAYDQIGLVRERIGNRSSTDSPRNAYQTMDNRYIAISASTQKSFERLVEAMGMGELGRDPRFTDGLARQRNADVLDQLMSNWFRGKDFAEAQRILEEGEVVSGPVLTIAEIFKDPHYAARETIATVPDHDFTSLRMPNATPRMSRTPGKIRHSGQELGSSNEAIYCGELGLSAAEIAKLKDLQVI